MANFNNWADGSRIGNYFAGASGFGSTETEEERRRREYEEALKQQQPGSAMTPAAASIAAAPQAPVVPVAPQIPQVQGIQPPPQVPNQPYSGQGLDPRQVQAESGGRNFDAQGNPITSPKGAMFANQVMPATAQNPGFGIRPAQAQTPEEYNRVGNEYMDMLRKRYGGDEATALAAYNAGPGRIDKNLAAAGGQLNRKALPAETQAYIDKILPPATGGATTSVNPNQAPAPAAAPAAQPAPTQQPTPAPQGEGYYDQRWYDTFKSAQENPLAMVALANNTTAPAGIRKAAEVQQFTVLQMARDKQLGERQVEQAKSDPNAMARIMKEKNEEGSWAKAVLFSVLGSKSLAENEYTKLGKGAVWQNSYDEAGNPVLTQIRADGLPMRGFDIATGNELDSKQLASVAGGGSSGLGKGASLSADVYIDKVTGNRYRSGYDNQGRAAMVNIQGGGIYRGDPKNLSVQSIDTAAKKTENEQAIKLKYTGPMAYTKESAGAAGKFNFDNGTNVAYEVITPGTNPILVDRNNNNQPVKFDSDGNIQVIKNPQTSTQTTTPAGTTTTSTTATPTGPRFREPGFEQESPGQFKSRQQQYDTQAGETAKVVGEDIGNAKKNIGKDKSRASYLIRKIDELEEHPGFKKAVGVYNSDLGGVPVPFGGAVAGMLPATDVTAWNKRFKEVQGQSYLQGIQELKGTGAITEKEGQAAQDAIQRMSASTSEEEFRAAAADFKSVIKRGIDRQARKAGQKPVYNEPEVDEEENKTKTNVPYKVVG